MSVVKSIGLWENNPDKTRTSYVAKIDFITPQNYYVPSISELKDLIRNWIKAEERRYPLANGYMGRYLLLNEILKIFNEEVDKYGRN